MRLGLLLLLFTNFCCGSVLRFTPLLQYVQFPDTSGVSVETTSTFNGMKVYAASFSYPFTTSASLPPNAAGKIVTSIGAINVTSSRILGYGPFDNWIGPLSMTIKTNVTGVNSIFHVQPKILSDGTNLKLSFETISIKRQLPVVTINYANCLILFI